MILDAFHKALCVKIDELADRKRDDILRGFGDTAESIALKYKYDAGYLAALADVKDVAIEVERVLYNRDKDAA